MIVADSFGDVWYVDTTIYAQKYGWKTEVPKRYTHIMYVQNEVFFFGGLVIISWWLTHELWWLMVVDYTNQPVNHGVRVGFVGELTTLDLQWVASDAHQKRAQHRWGVRGSRGCALHGWLFWRSPQLCSCSCQWPLCLDSAQVLLGFAQVPLKLFLRISLSLTCSDFFRFLNFFVLLCKDPQGMSFHQQGIRHCTRAPDPRCQGHCSTRSQENRGTLWSLTEARVQLGDSAGWDVERSSLEIIMIFMCKHMIMYM